VSPQPSSDRIGGKGSYHNGVDFTGTPEDNDLGSADGEYEAFATPVYLNACANAPPNSVYVAHAKTLPLSTLMCTSIELKPGVCRALRLPRLSIFHANLFGHQNFLSHGVLSTNDAFAV
jgi:hypothetical protein